VRPSFREAGEFIQHDPGFEDACWLHRRAIRVEQWIPQRQMMQPVAAAELWDVPRIESVDALCAMLGLHTGELEWLADLKGIAARSAEDRLQNYWYRTVKKSSGGLRLIEAPKRRLKQAQRAVLRGVLEKFPVHAAVHGFVPGRSVRSFAAPHVGRMCVLRMDLEDFFPSIRASRVQAVFRTAGYPDRIASLLAGVCTNAAPRRLWKDDGISIEERIEARELYSWPHLPQGAPSSPALANICAYRMDCRLSGLARATGAEYTRYADDLVFSGDREFAARARQLQGYVGAIAAEEGFRLNFRKTRTMSQAMRQCVAGLVVNQRLNVRRDEFDLLKATLTNCLRSGVASQNRENHPSFAEHLKGKMEWVASIHPGRGDRLRRLYEQIDWADD
jgi:retron-type reverse transcriptase